MSSTILLKTYKLLFFKKIQSYKNQLKLILYPTITFALFLFGHSNNIVN
ncbi:unnamed protein product [Paramecium sonneborni]|uniref:Uncharacterized protein n=1 Tax=Paramecium sonneborni TaxID=65129 RepID=A0A8S1R8U4_9CILI|nr:unnamed protein product [Paramecium sonneborni]